jgi:hypothetical protein
MGPLAGNLRIDRNAAWLDHLEGEALGGRLSGQALVEYAGDDTEVRLRASATGIRPREGEDRLDAHAALVLKPGRRSVEGKVHIVRIAAAHLLDLLDLADPYREDTGLNRLRLALAVGWPKRVSLGLRSGFLDLAVELGGLGSLVRIDRIRGLPLGPLLRRLFAPGEGETDATARDAEPPASRPASAEAPAPARSPSSTSAPQAAALPRAGPAAKEPGP